MWFWNYNIQQLLLKIQLLLCSSSVKNACFKQIPPQSKLSFHSLSQTLWKIRLHNEFRSQSCLPWWKTNKQTSLHIISFRKKKQATSTADKTTMLSFTAKTSLALQHFHKVKLLLLSVTADTFTHVPRWLIIEPVLLCDALHPLWLA